MFHNADLLLNSLILLLACAQFIRRLLQGHVRVDVQASIVLNKLERHGARGQHLARALVRVAELCATGVMRRAAIGRSHGTRRGGRHSNAIVLFFVDRISVLVDVVAILVLVVVFVFILISIGVGVFLERTQPHDRARACRVLGSVFRATLDVRVFAWGVCVCVGVLAVLMRA